MNSVLVFSEKHISSNASEELFNLCIITGKVGKTSSGLISLKEKNNSQGLFDMGIFPELAVGMNRIDDQTFITKLKKAWHINSLPETINPDQHKLLEEGTIKNLFIFGEDPIGCAVNKDEVRALLSKAEFKVVMDYFMTETASEADLIMPASLPIESGGSYSNTQRFLLHYDMQMKSNVEKRAYEQLIDLMNMFGIKNRLDLTNNITLEIATLLTARELDDDERKYSLVYTEGNNYVRMFNYGCDFLVKKFEEDFNQSFLEN